MKILLTIAILLLIAGGTAAQDVQYFPNLAFDDNQDENDFIVQWYTSHLKALQEPSLLEQATTGKQAYRFLWLRSFHNPISVRLNVNPDGTSLLTVKETSGRGGYAPGHLTTNVVKTLSKEETDWFLGCVQEVKYWNLPTREPKTDVIGTDGAQWVIEGVKDGKYKVVDRWSPEKGAVHSLGITMLIDLAKLKLLYQEVY